MLEFWLWSWPFLHFFIEIEKLLSKIWWLAGDFALWRPIRQEMSAVLDRTLKNISGQVIQVGFVAYAPLQHFCSHFKVGNLFAILSTFDSTLTKSFSVMPISSIYLTYCVWYCLIYYCRQTFDHCRQCRQTIFAFWYLCYICEDL